MVIMRVSKEIQEGVWFTRIKEHFNVRPVIIEVRPGETREDSWKRYLLEHPEAKYATVRVFHRAKYDQGPLNSGASSVGDFTPKPCQD
jgi:hypothetical protein